MEVRKILAISKKVQNLLLTGKEIPCFKNIAFILLEEEQIFDEGTKGRKKQCKQQTLHHLFVCMCACNLNTQKDKRTKLKQSKYYEEFYHSK